MHIIAVGRLRNAPESDLFDRYDMRLRPRLVVVEIPEAYGDSATAKRREAASLLAAVPRDGFAVPLDLGGRVLDSDSFAAKLLQWSELHRPICFLIGGAEGLHRSVLDRADFVLSFGAATWPHFLVRAMLAEQLYRAQTISSGHPYHRSGRPQGGKRRLHDSPTRAMSSEEGRWKIPGEVPWQTRRNGLT
jgi:23S rRNA (pseudouridine1915-N3)-methyltransferase